MADAACKSVVQCHDDSVNVQAPPTTETEVFLVMFDYIDRLFGIVRPRKLLYMAIGKPRLALTSLACLMLENSHELSESKAHAHHRKLRVQKA